MVADVGFIALFRQCHLLLALAESVSLALPVAVRAVRAADAGVKVFAGHVVGSNWHAAGVTLLVVAFAQLVIYGDAVVKYEAFTLPG